jgi:hypothetical protein
MIGFRVDSRKIIEKTNKKDYLKVQHKIHLTTETEIEKRI